MQRLSETVRKLRSKPAHLLISKLNAIIRGWSNYHKAVVSKQTFQKIDNHVFWLLWKWIRYSHKGWKRTLYKKYFTKGDKPITFSVCGKTKKGWKIFQLYRIGYVPIRRHVKIRGEAQPFDAQHDTYFEIRVKWRKKSFGYAQDDFACECNQKTLYLCQRKQNNNVAAGCSYNKECLKSA